MQQMLVRRFDAGELRRAVRDRFDYDIVARQLFPIYEGVAAREREVA